MFGTSKVIIGIPGFVYSRRQAKGWRYDAVHIFGNGYRSKINVN
jgi:hypothetical protein